MELKKEKNQSYDKFIDLFSRRTLTFNQHTEGDHELKVSFVENGSDSIYIILERRLLFYFSIFYSTSMIFLKQ